MRSPIFRRAKAFALAVAALLSLPDAAHAQSIHVIISGGFTAAYRELLPAFTRATHIEVTTSSGASVGDGPNTIGGQLRRGVAADVVILSREGLSELVADGWIAPGTDVDLARSLIGVVVRAGAPRPDISSVEAFKQALVHAQSVAMTTSTSGVYLTKTLFPKLGIADEMAGKINTSGSAAVGRGEAELGIQQISELLPLAGVDFVGRIPEAIQYVTIYAAAVVAGSKNIDAGKALVAFLASADADPAIVKSGMEPARTVKR